MVNLLLVLQSIPNNPIHIIDSYNGVNVFVAYKWARYAVVEYVVNSTSLYWYKHS